MQTVLLGRAWLPPVPSALWRQRQESCCKSEVSLGCRVSYRPDWVVESLKSKSTHTKLTSFDMYQVHTNSFLKVCVCVGMFLAPGCVCEYVACMYSCALVPVCSWCLGIQEKLPHCPGTGELWAATWLLGTEPRSSARTGSALNCWTISPGPHTYILSHFTYKYHKSVSLCGLGTVKPGNMGNDCSFRNWKAQSSW